MKLNDILNFDKFYKAVKGEKMPVKLAYRLSKLSSQVEQERKFYEEKVRELVDKYGDKDSEGNPIVNDQGGIKLREDTQKECLQQFTELDNLDIEFSFVPFSITDVESFEVTPEEFECILPFLAD